MLPEWIWQLRTRWASTLVYQTIRDGISDSLDLFFWSAKTKSMRKRFNPDIGPVTTMQSEEILSPPQMYNTALSERPLYEMLPKGSIRLLSLLPDLENNVVQVKLSVHTLDEITSYEALSYHWGTRNSEFLLCGGRKIRVQDNLRDVLTALRTPGAERLLWVDALCINQHDVQEKSDQVQLMQHIYHNSNRVVVWLGKHTKDSNTGVNLLLKISALARSEEHRVAHSSKALAPTDISDMGLPSAGSSDWKSLNSVMWRPWFTRVWIIQELAVSRSAVVYCGDSCFTWLDMVSAAQFLLDHYATPVTNVDPRLVTRLELFRQSYLSSKNSISLLPLILEGRSSYAIRDRDKIFALLGLSSRPASDFIPDYSSSVDEVFISFAKYHIEQTANLEILNAVEDHSFRLKRKLPSWVPDWEVHALARPFVLLDMYALWEASTGSENSISIQFKGNDRTLVVKGFVVDTIRRVSDSFLEYIPLPGTAQDYYPHLKTQQAKTAMHSISDFLMQQRYRQWEKLAQRANKRCSKDELMDNYVRTITAELLSKSQPSADVGSTSFTRVEAYRAWRKHWSTISEFQGKNVSKFHTSATAAEIQMATVFMDSHQKAAYGRHFFTSKLHRYMGLCPTLTRNGDLLVILLGGKTPYVVRKAPRGRFGFVGECYASGLMKGELFSQRASSDHKLKCVEFHIV